MKKILLFMAVALVALSACEGPAGRDGIDGEGANWYIQYVDVKSSQWQLVNGVDQIGSYFKYEISVPALDEFVYEEGNVFCYMFQIVNGREVQTLLPFSDTRGESDQNGEYLWTEIYACDFSVGKVTFYVNYTDFYTSNRPPDASFRIVLNW